MPVVPAHEGLTVGPDHVYVIPPNVTLTLRDDRLHLTPTREWTCAPHAGCFYDITGRKQAEEQLREYADQLANSDRRKNEFLAMLWVVRY
jgi:hypothetical protein